MRTLNSVIVSYDQVKQAIANYDNPLDRAQSTYGDPEEALLFQEALKDPEYLEEYNIEQQTYLEYHAGVNGVFEGAWYALSPKDRSLVESCLEGVSQTEIAERLGVSQPSISYKLKSIKEWLDFTCKGRIFLASCVEPWYWHDPKLDELVRLKKETFDRFAWGHEPISQICRDMGRLQSTLYGWLVETIWDFSLANHDKVATIEKYLCNAKWTRKDPKPEYCEKGWRNNKHVYKPTIEYNKAFDGIVPISRPQRLARKCHFWKATFKGSLNKNIKKEAEILHRFGHNNYVVIQGEALAWDDYQERKNAAYNKYRIYKIKDR